MKIITIIFALFLSASLYCQNWDEIDIKPIKVTDNIYMLTGGGGNIGLCVGEDGIVMIDDQFAPLSEKINATLREISDQEIKYLINTHWHGDHTGGNENFANDGATIVAHDNVHKRLSTEQIRPFGRTTPASPEAAWPQLTFDERMTIHFNGQSIHLIHIHNAHTDGDAFVYFPEDNVLHMGDCFFKDRFPYIDRDMGGSPDGAIKAVELALMIADGETQIIPGHGSLANKDDLLRYHTMLITMRDRIKKVIKENVSEEDLDFDSLTQDYETWGGGFINNEKMVKTFFSAYTD
ncbi:MAG: MBL fold metallo-hydrolase [Saprospiraceae bacterium]|nr:MBL fold metallo-hydrolase [Bacteroidia bacterium]NNE15087.1 MBL fold metallo-hydrolase [Saprospiraceae bacterium]